MPSLDPNYVLAPFYGLLARCQTNVLVRLRLIEHSSAFVIPRRKS